MKFCFEFDVDCFPFHHHPTRLIPSLGPIREQQGPVVPKPEFSGPLHSKRNLLMAFTMTDSQQVDVTIKPVDKKGNPAQLDGVPEWLTDNPSILALTPSADGLTCQVTAVGMLGTANIQVTGDADLGTGVTPIIGTLEVTIIGGQATTITLTPGTPTEQP